MNTNNINRFFVAVIALSYSVNSLAFLTYGTGGTIGIDGAMTTPDFYDSVTNPVTQAIKDLSSDITKSIKDNLGQTVKDLSKTIEANGKAQMSHLEKIHEADRTNQLEIDRQKMIEQRSMDGAYLPAGNTCTDRAAAATAAVSDQTIAYQARRYDSAIKYRSSKAPGTQEQLNASIENHKIYYCDPSTDPTKCDGHVPAKSYTKGGQKVLMPDADNSSRSLFNGAGNADHFFNLTFVPEQMDAASAYIQNAIDSGDTPRALSPAEAKTDEGKIYLGLKLAYESRMDLSRAAMLEIMGARAPIEGSEKLVQSMLDMTSSDYGMKDYISARIAAIQNYAAFGSSPKLSAMELLDIQVKSRADNASWLAYISNAEPLQVAKEQAVMTSLLLRVQYMQLRNQEVQSALQALNAAESAKANLLPKINTAMSNLSHHQ